MRTTGMGSQEMRSELRQCFRSKMRPDGVILQLRVELVSDLLVNGVNYLLSRKHASTLPRITGIQTDEFR